MVLSLCDLTASTVSGVGAVWVSASTTQMLRGSSVLFTGIMSMLILKYRLTRGQWIGIAVVLLALIMVGAATELRGIYNSITHIHTRTAHPHNRFIFFSMCSLIPPHS